MKIILVALAVYALWWLLRRSFGHIGRRHSSQAPAVPQAMLACAYCGMHMPSEETLPGRGGVFCSDAHRAAFEKANPKP